MKLEVGMYVKSKYGIGKIDDTRNFMNKYFEVHLDTNKGPIHNVADNTYWCTTEDIIKASDKLIDLIEVGDILCLLDKEYDEKYKAEIVLDCNNVKSIVNYEQCNLLNLEYELITEEHIKVLQILTSEIFEQMSYKVGE